MNLELTREQFLTLLEGIHIAGHVRGGETTDLEKVLLKCAHEAGLAEAVAKDGEAYGLGKLLSRALHDEMHRFEDDMFWSSLADELAARDLRFIKSEEEIEAMSDAEYDSIVEGQAARYDAEFTEHGSDHLTLAHPLPLS